MLFQKLQRAQDSPQSKATRGPCQYSIQQLLDKSLCSSDSEVDTPSFLNEFPLSKDLNSSGSDSMVGPTSSQNEALMNDFNGLQQQKTVFSLMPTTTENRDSAEMFSSNASKATFDFSNRVDSCFRGQMVGSSLLHQSGSEQGSASKQMTSKGAQAPKLNAMNLFAFREDGFTSAFTGGFGQQTRPSFHEQLSQKWVNSAQKISAARSDSVNSHLSSENSNIQSGSPSKELQFWQKRTMDSPRSSDSSWTEEICHNALAYLDSGSDSEDVPTKMSRSSSKDGLAKDFSFKQDNSRPADSTQDESSFLSAENQSNLTFTQNNSVENIEVFQPTIQKQGSHVVQQSTFNFYPEQRPVVSFQPSVNVLNTMGANSRQSSMVSNTFTPNFMETTASFTPSEQKVSGIFQNFQPSQELSREEFEIIQSVDTMCFDQSGCRMIQKRLERLEDNSDHFVSSLVQAMLHIFPQVSCNQFGNYLCQKLIEVCTNEDLKKLVYCILPSCCEMSINQHGTRAMQTLVENLANDHQEFHNELLVLIAELEKQILLLCTHNHGNHVVQTFLVRFRASDVPSDADKPGCELFGQYTEFVFRACRNWPIDIGTHKQGCCVMQRCLEKGLHTQKIELAEVIINEIAGLIEDPYGNYLVQNVLKIQDDPANQKIFNFIAGDFIRLSKLKFSSNVIEKCLEIESCVMQIARILLGSHKFDDITLVQELGDASRDKDTRLGCIVEHLATHSFGNYVLQKVLLVNIDWNLKKQVLEEIKLQASSMMTTKHGPKVLQKLQKTYPRIFAGVPTNTCAQTSEKKNQRGRTGQQKGNKNQREYKARAFGYSE